MKKKIFMLFFLGLILMFGAVNVNADEIKTFYADAGENVILEDDVIGESALAGTIVDVIGNIDGIGFLAGETVNSNGTIEYGFMAGNTVNISGMVEKSLFVASTEINLTDTAKVGRDLFGIGETIVINGDLGRSLNLTGTSVTIGDNTVINGDVKIDATNITIGDNVVIHGTLNYNDDANVDISENGTIIPSIKKYSNASEDEGFDTSALLSSMVNLVIVFLVITIVIPRAIDKTEMIYKNADIHKWIRSIGFGFALYLCIPIVCLLLLLSNIGIALGLIIVALFAISIYLSYIFAGFVFGNLLLVKGLKLKSNKYLSGIIGILLIKLLVTLPVIGPFIGFICATIGIAIIWNLVMASDKKNNKVNAVKPKEEVKKAEVVKSEKNLGAALVKEEKKEVKKAEPVKKEANATVVKDVEPVKKESIKAKTSATKKAASTNKESTAKKTATKKTSTKKEDTPKKTTAKKTTSATKTTAKKETAPKKATTKKATSKKESN